MPPRAHHIDDFFSVSIEDVESQAPVPQSEKRLRQAQRAYEEEGLIGSKEKDVVSQELAKVAGAELDGSQFTRNLGLCTVAAPASKRLGLSFLSLQLASIGATTDSLHACLLGGWTSCLMYRRPLMAILDRVHSFADLSISQSGEPSDSPSSSPCRSGVRLAGRSGPFDVFRYLSKDLAFPFCIRCF